MILASIDLRRWGGARARIVGFLGAHGGDWCELSAEALRRWCGVGRGWGTTVLAELVEGRVLERRPGAGGRAHAYRLHGDLMRWDGVPWLVDPELVEARVIALHVEQDRAEADDPEGVLARSYTARPDLFLARSYTARGARTHLRFSRGPTPRENDSHQELPRAVKTARRSEAARAVLDRARTAAAAKEGSPSSFGDDEVGSSLRARSSDELTADEAKAIRAISHRASGAYLRGVVFDQALGLIERFGPDEVIAALGRMAPAPASAVKALLHDLGLELAAGPSVDVEPAVELASVSPIERAQRAASLRRLVATYQAEGAEVPEDLQSELAELEACENGPRR